ncbi:MAG: glycosyltransferase family 2 protein [Candidatus Scalindua sp.]
MTGWQLKTPVALIIFNRPDTTERVFNEIANVRPPKLLVVADGPRSDHPGELEKCAEAQAIIERVDWDCEVITNFSEVNMGCRKRVSSGIDWIFEQVPEAIILEDDCLPHPDFFRYCEELLEFYRNDSRIVMISGDNFQFGKKRGNGSYYFSRYVHIWGWASWRRAWEFYDVSMADWPAARDSQALDYIYASKKEKAFWEKNFDAVYSNVIDTWDFQWVFTCWNRYGLSVLPQQNMISNIGFNADATHTQCDSKLSEIPVHGMVFPLRHPPRMLPDTQADSDTFKKVFSPTRRLNIIPRTIKLLGSRGRDRSL